MPPGALARVESTPWAVKFFLAFELSSLRLVTRLMQEWTSNARGLFHA